MVSKFILLLSKLLNFLFNIFTYLGDLSFDMLKHIYNFLFDYIYILDSDIRRDIFIGVTGLTIAIIIFIAEVISNKKYELDKKVILKKTKIKKNMVFCIFIYLIMFIGTIVICTYTKDENNLYIKNDILYFLIQLIINISIIMFMYKTIKTFIIAVKLNTDNDYFSCELDKYINERTIEIEKKANNKSLKKSRNLKKEFSDYIKNHQHLSKDFLASGLCDDLYLPIYPTKNGILKKYDYKKIDSLLEDLTKKKADEPNEYIESDKVIIYFVKEIGDKINKNEPIAYCLKNYYKQFKELSNSIIYDNNNTYIDDEIKTINEDLFSAALEFNEPDDFDGNNKLFNYFNHLYKNDLIGIKNIALNKLEETAKRVYNDQYKNKKFSRFLNRVLSLSFTYDNYEDYCFINGLNYILYSKQLEFENNDIKQVAYDFSIHYFRFNYYSVQKNKDIRFYDNLMSYLLRFLCNLIKKKQFDSITVIFNNISLDNEDYSDGDLDEKEILNFQFSCGVVSCLILVDLDVEHYGKIKNIIDWLQRNLFNLYDAWLIIINFKKYFDKNTNIQSVYDDFDYNFHEHKYLSWWSGSGRDEKAILKDLLIAFNIDFVIETEINYDTISKDDNIYYEGLLSLFQNEEQTKFEKILNIKYQKEDLMKALQLVINETKRKEDEYIREHKLDDEKVKSFEANLKSEILKEEPIIELLKTNKKIGKSDIKLKKVYGINQLIPRNLFFPECYGLDTIAKDYGKVFGKGIRESYIKKINSFAVCYAKDINEMIEEISDIDNYVLLTNNPNSRKVNNYDSVLNAVKINGKLLKMIKIPKIDSFYLIAKRDLPILEFCEFEDIYSSQNIDKSLFYSFEDCSTDEKLRDNIIKNSSWLSKKGDLEQQQNYLKTQCSLRVYLSYRIKKCKNSTAIRIKYDAPSKF